MSQGSERPRTHEEEVEQAREEHMRRIEQQPIPGRPEAVRTHADQERG